jgi:hypothetical protein
MNGSNRGSFKNSLSHMSKLDQEIMAAEKFLSQANDGIIQQKGICYGRSDFDNESGLNNNILKDENIEQNSTNIECDEDILRYRKQLKSYGFPEIGNMSFLNIEEKEKTLKFLDFLILKKTNENGERVKFTKNFQLLTEKINKLQNDNSRLEKELTTERDEVRKLVKEKRDIESRLNKNGEQLRKQIEELKGMNTKLTNKNNIVTIEKKAIEEKYNKISENYQKFVNRNTLNLKSNNNIEIIDTLKRNDLLKLLSRANGTEKLVETMKNGFNESLRDLLFEISALKNFIYDMNKEIENLLCKNDLNLKIEILDYKLLNMPFLDIITKVKYVFKRNITTVKYVINDLNELNEKNELQFTFEKSHNQSQFVNNTLNMSPPKKTTETIRKETIFDIEDDSSRGDKNSTINKSSMLFKNEDTETTEYQDELEFLKNKWVKTLMGLKANQNEEDN